MNSITASNVNNQHAAQLSDDHLLNHRCSEACMHCGFEPPQEQRREYRFDFMQRQRRMDLLDAVNERRGSEHLTGAERFSSAFIVEQAAHRYFMLVQDIQARLKGRFTAAEFDVILNCECQPVWQWDTYMPVAAMVADDQGVESLDELPEGSPLRVLLDKLQALTVTQDAALVDACERVWRGYDNPLL